MMQSTFLRRVLALDAVSCAAMGLGLSLGAGVVAPVLGVPEAFVRGAGFALLPVAAFILFVASRPTPAALLVWLVILGNLAWVLESLLVPSQFAGTISGVGVAFTLAQAGFVLVMAALEYVGLRRLTRATA